MRKKILWIGDGPDCASGFGRATREILACLDYRLGGAYDVTVLGINHLGDPGTVPYPVYVAAVGGDAFGIGRLIWMCHTVKPDVIVIQNDGWNVPTYFTQLNKFTQFRDIPVIGVIAVDGKNFQGRWLDGLSLAVFWTQFALDEARAGGYEGPAEVIPLGVDIATYYPMDRKEAREHRLPVDLREAFIIGNVNRNQPRKRWDLMIKIFATWLHRNKIEDAYLYLHCAPTGDTGSDVEQLARYYNVIERLCLVQPPTFYGVSEAEMRVTYNCFDVQLTTTQGEGFGLTTFEGMACGVPQIVPAWSALEELTKDAALQIPCSTTAIGPPYVNVIGGILDEQPAVNALQSLYLSADHRAKWSNRALACIEDPRYRWEHIGRAYAELLKGV